MLEKEKSGEYIFLIIRQKNLGKEGKEKVKGY